MKAGSLLTVGQNETQIRIIFPGDDEISGFVRDQLRLDFERLLAPESPTPFAVLEIGTDLGLAKGPVAVRFKGCRISFSGNRRRFHYDDGCEGVFIEGTPLRLRLSGTDAGALARRALLFVHALLGEALEKRGLVRFHALSFSDPHRAFLLSAPSGTGKSSLATALLRHSDFPLAGDEVSLLEPGLFRIQPFPTAVRLKTGPERVTIPDSRVAETTPLRRLFAVKRARPGQGSRSRPLALHERVILFFQIVIGWHLPQIAEIYLRPKNLPHLARTAIRRARVARILLRDARMLEISTCEIPLRREALEQILACVHQPS